MGREEVAICAGRGLLYAGKPVCRKAAPSKILSRVNNFVFKSSMIKKVP